MPSITTAFAQGLLASRPAASAANTGFVFLATDVGGGTLYQSTGSSWVQLAGSVSAGAGTFSGEVSATDVKATGLGGAVAASRYVGATASGAPASGTFALGDFCIDQTGFVWVCTVAGTPGTWTKVGGGATSVTTKGDVQGYSTTAARIPVGTNGQVLTADSTQALGVKWAAVAGAGSDSVLLSYALASDISALALTNGSWVDLVGNQTFTPTVGSAVVEIWCGGMCQLSGSGGQGATRLVIDSAGTPTYLYLGGCQANQNLLSGSVPQILTTLSAAAHTVKLQAYATSVGSPLAYCRAATQPNNEFLAITVIQRA